MVNRANGFASAQDYAQAIPLYEQVVRELPQEATLKKNLSVLYFNHAMALQDAKRYEEAGALLDQAAQISPNEFEIRRARAAGYFLQAMDLKSQESRDFEQMRALLDQALSIDGSQSVFRQALASTYLEEAYEHAMAERYAKALPLLETGRELDPENGAIRQSLANVYLGLAKEAKIASNEADFEAYAAKAVATDDNPRLQRILEQLRNPGGDTEIASASGNASFDTLKESRKKGKLPASAAKLTVMDMVLDVENGLGLEPNQGSLTERVVRAEEKVYGKTQDGALASRAKELYGAVLGQNAMAAADPNTTQAPVESGENSYLDQVFRVTDGKVIRWGKFPLRVHIDEPKDNPAFRAEYVESVRQALNAWNIKSNGFISYVEVKNPDAADVRIQWDEQYVDRFADPDTVPEFYRTYTPPKNSPMMKALQMAGMFTPGFYSLAPQAINAALQYREYKKLEPLIEESTIKLGLTPTQGLSDEEARLLVRNMAAKEFGHVLGLKGHSPQQGDLMYPELRHDVAQTPTGRDMETLRQLYNRPANIILNFR